MNDILGSEVDVMNLDRKSLRINTGMITTSVGVVPRTCTASVSRECVFGVSQTNASGIEKT